jgi:3-methyladenine DNA glycosylase AlkD
MNPPHIADEIHRQIQELQVKSAEPVRAVRREFSRSLRNCTAQEMLAVAYNLFERQRWVAYELIYFHPIARSNLEIEAVERLGRGIDGWDSVDAFARYISGPAWQCNLILDTDVRRWAESPDRFWRRTALVSTVPLNLRVAGGTGDTDRTLEICSLLVTDRDDTIVKAMSWALRSLVIWDAAAVRCFLHDYDSELAARVKREVRNKLNTGLKTPRKS